MAAALEIAAGEAERAEASAPLLHLTYFTDPLCCWSWAFEPQWRKLRYSYAGRIAWRLRMGGLIPDWQSFCDPVNSVHRPSQMGPIWLHAKQLSGMPIEANIWIEDPPVSSWPACIAVKAAGLQSPLAADLYLRRLREAAMAEGRNIAKREALLELASDVSSRAPELFDPVRFAADLDGAEARAAFQEDIMEARFHRAGRFPCLMARRACEPAQFLTGWRDYYSLESAILALAPGLGPPRLPQSPEAYRIYWGSLTERELREIL